MTFKLAGRCIAPALCALLLAPPLGAVELAVSNAAFVLPMVDLESADDADREPRPAIATSIVVSPDGEIVAAGGDDHCVRVWDAKTGRPLARLDGHEDWVRGLHISPDGGQLASVGNDGAVCFWNPLTGAAASQRQKIERGALASVVFHPNGQRLLTVGFRTPLRIHDLTKPDTSNELSCACEDTRCVAISRDGRFAAAAGRNGRLRVWDLEQLQALPDVPADRQRVHSVAFAPNNKMIATGGDSRVIRFWNAESGELLAELPTGGTKIRSMLFLNSEQLAVGGVDNSVNIWSISSRVPTHRLVGHTGSVAALSCDATGQILASASYDTTVRVWRLGQAKAAETASRDQGEGIR